MSGRHRAPKKKSFRKMSTVLAAATAIPVLAPSLAFANENVLEAIATCESGNRNIPTGIKKSDGSPASSATGYLQIIKGTWQGYGGEEFAPRAMEATREEQFIVGARILKGQGLGAWSESQHCWDKKVKAKKQPVKIDVARKVAESYVVKTGDTLSKIAARHGMIWQELYAANMDVVENPNEIFPGEKLTLK